MSDVLQPPGFIPLNKKKLAAEFSPAAGTIPATGENTVARYWLKLAAEFSPAAGSFSIDDYLVINCD